MRILNGLALLFVLHSRLVEANTEKVIFVAPALTTLPDAKPGLDFLQLPALSHQDHLTTSSLSVSFPSDKHAHGSDHWFLLRSLNPQQRYELRVCWPATQPTNFWLHVHSLSDVFDTPHLIQNLAASVERPRPREAHSGPSIGASTTGETHESLLFLHIEAAADFFTANKSLMLNPPDVDVDIILDAYVVNVFPQSLTSTAVYIIVLASGGWILSYFIWKALSPTVRNKSHKE